MIDGVVYPYSSSGHPLRMWRGWITNRTALLALAIGLGVLQFVGTLGSSADTAALAGVINVLMNYDGCVVKR